MPGGMIRKTNFLVHRTTDRSKMAHGNGLCQSPTEQSHGGLKNPFSSDEIDFREQFFRGADRD